MKTHRPPESKKWLIEMIATAIIYYGAARLGLLLAFRNTNASPVWPPSGIASAMILLLGYRVWPGIIIGAFLANVVVFLANKTVDTGSIVAVSSFIATGNTLEAVSGAFLLHHFVGFRNPLSRSRDVFIFVSVALLMCLVSSTIGPTSLCLAGIAPWSLYRTIWFTWWLGDTVGILILTPFLLTWFKLPLVRWRSRLFVELVLSLVLLFAVCQIVFGHWLLISYPQAFILIPFIVWAAFRFGQSAVVLSTLLVSGVAIWGTIHGSGPFVREMLNEWLWLLQSFVGIVTVTGLVLAAVLTERKRVEEVLRDSEERYRALYEDNPSMYFTVDSEGKVLSVNKFGAEQLGYTAEELVGQSVLNVFYEDDKKPVLERVTTCLQNPGKVFHWEFRKVRKDGSMLWVREVARAACDTSGNMVALIVCEDINERKRAEDQLQKVYNELEIRVKERTLELAKTNETLQAEIVGHKWAEEALKESFAQLSKKNRYETIISTITRSVHRSINLDEVLENAVDAMSKNIDGVDNIAIYLVEGKEAILKAYRGFTDSYVERARRIPYPKGFTWKTIIDGSPMYCADVEQDTIIGAAGREMGTKSYVSMPINCGGKAVGTININSLQKNAFDEEEIKLLEIVAQQIETAFNNARQAEALRQSEERYRDFVENSLDLICIHDLEGNILSVNRALIKQLGYERAEDFVGRKISDFLPPHRRHLFGPYIDTLAKEGEARGLMRVLTRSGEERILEYNNSLRTEGVDKPIIRGVSHDVTERQRAEEALQQSHAQLAKKNRYETIVSTVTQSVHKSIKLQDVLENAVEAMSKNIDEADHISIYLVEGEEAVLRAYRGSLEFLIERVRRIPYSRGFTWKTIIEGKSSYVADADQDTAIGPVGKEIGTKSYVSMPIYHEGKTVGVININSLQRNAFNEEDLKLLEIVTHQIETAFNNGRQAEALRKARDELEMRVRERTAELTEVNKVLQIEISERKEVEEELRESEGRFSSFMQNLPAAAWIKDIKECYIYANRIGEEIFHKKLSDLIGKTDDEIFPADTAKQFKENDKLVITRGESLQTIETLPQEDGIHHSIVSKFPIFDHNGALVMIGGVAIDITERMNAEEALRESEERYRTFVEHTYDLLIEVTVDGRFLYVSSNFKDVLGYEPIELLGRSIFEHIHPDDRPAATTEFMRAVATFSTGHAVYRFRHKDGQWLWFESTGKPFQAAPGEIRGFIASRDITERRRMEEELIKTQKLESIGVLAGGVAHDFNNLLTAILGNISLTKMYANPEDDIYKRLTEAEKACLRAKGLTQQLLTFSKGGAPIKKVAFIKGLIKDSATFALIGSNVRCEFHMAEDLWKVEVDEGQISQVINNLVINAVQAMPEGGAIRVRAENVNFGLGEGLPLKEGKYVKVTMEDEGIGIPEEHLSKIFDPYFTTKQKGSGLGLAAAYSIIRSHNGYIGVESDLGVGTKFYIHLPASEKEILAKGDIKERPIIGKGRILVMDDDEAVRGVIGAVLRRIGYEVEFARDGEEAIELYREAKGSSKPFNIVIMDLTVLGGMGGREAIKRLLEIDPRIKAIVSSGYSNDPVISEYKKYGFSGVVAKPFKIQELGDVLNRIIQETSQEAV